MRHDLPTIITGFPSILTALEAAGEGTRLRLLALLSEAELTVSELVAITGQSQPRISRHLRLLVEAGLVERHREGAWAFFTVSTGSAVAGLAHDIVRHLDPADRVLIGDKARLAEVRAARHAMAERYFATRAADWDRLRVLHVADERVEAAVLALAGAGPFEAVLDLGTGTGRMLELLAGRAGRAVGIDTSPAMLAVARARLDRGGLRNVQLRQGDLYALPTERNGYDLAIIHQVLHYLDDPGRALREAARMLRPAGRLIVVDFAPHVEESLRTDHAHRRLGFARGEIDGLMLDAGLAVGQGSDVLPLAEDAGKLTVSVWLGQDRRTAIEAGSRRQKAVA